jgi:orotate phosphoribosyltransferase
VKLSYTLFDNNTIAKDLLEIGAVKFQPDDPFKFTSGRISPIYVDVRMMIGVNAVRARLAASASNFIYRTIGSTNFSIIAGGETAGIPIATLLADRIHKPLCYVRKAPKGFGKGAQIEGLSEAQLSERKNFLLAEDLCSDGGSKLVFIDAIRKTGNLVNDAFVVFSYGVFGAEKTLADHGVTLHAMIDAAKLIEVAQDLEAFPPQTIMKIKEWLESQAPAVVAEASSPTETIEPVQTE